MKRQAIPLALLCCSAVLGPIMGGQISLESPQPLGSDAATLIQTLWSGPQCALLAWGLVGCLVAAAIAIGCATRKVVPSPAVPISWCALLFLFTLLFSVAISNYKAVSLASFCAFALYVGAFFATVGLAGRKSGPTRIAACMTTGMALVALNGIWEYVIQSDPTWRIFSNWFHPNALAGLLIMGLPLCLAFSCSDNLATCLAGVFGFATTATALLLTQSKGGYLAGAIGLLTFAVLSLSWSGGFKKALDRVFRGALCIGLTGILAFAVLRQPPSPEPPQTAKPTSGAQRKAPQQARPAGGSPGALTRIANADSTQDQSAGFRILLWKTATDLTKQNPAGWGLNTFRFQSGRPGRTTQTVFAHNTYLQLAAEASVFSPIILVALAATVMFFGLRGARKLAPINGPLRAGVFAAIIAGLAHNAVDSDLYHFGIGLSLFLLLGLAVQLSGDAGSPELMRKPVRWLVGVTPAGFALMLCYSGWVDVSLSRVSAAIAAGSRQDAEKGIRSLESSAPWDGRVAYYASYLESGPAGVARKCDEASQLMPTTRFYRASARAWALSGDDRKAADRLRKALGLDPNNLVTLLQLAKLEQAQGLDWIPTATRLVEVEKTTYYQIRSIPEIVPVETAEARVMLAQVETAPVKRVAQLRTACEIYVRFAELTVPRVKQMDRAISGAPFGDETATSALKKVQEGQAACAELKQVYIDSGSPEVRWAEAAEAKLASALGLLNS